MSKDDHNDEQDIASPQIIGKRKLRRYDSLDLESANVKDHHGHNHNSKVYKSLLYACPLGPICSGESNIFILGGPKVNFLIFFRKSYNKHIYYKLNLYFVLKQKLDIYFETGAEL